ncbi:Brp/Blh family beta-carotene 15,15'-dioxygenase [Altererythrobacter sp. MTPC7]|uniref:Brp/Blh family beta-carotene 15,15'-dioxygenase n=1 Tax=Altererythrobacter sp. MTPC7 TaxID=3056567 RepID=UPI0036F22121
MVACVAQIAGGAAPVVIGLCLFAAGLAHGAGDEQQDAIRPFGLLHAGAYVAVGLAFAGLFLAAPVAGLALFLALSAWHFARTECGFARSSRLAIASLATGGSVLFRPTETAAIFTGITGMVIPAPMLAILALVGAGGAALAGLAALRGDAGRLPALLALAATAVLHPVLAVGVIFLTGHALPVQKRQLARYGTDAVWRASAVPTLVALAGAAMLVAATTAGLLATAVAAALGIGLATPHMLTERLER